METPAQPPPGNIPPVDESSAGQVRLDGSDLFHIPWGVREVVYAGGLAVASFFLLGVTAVSIAIGVTGSTEGTGVTLAGMIATIIFYGALTAVVYGLALRRYKVGWSALGFRGLTSDIAWGPVVAVGAFAITASYTLAVDALGWDALIPDQDLDDLFESIALLPIVGLATIVLAPVVEETFFRGFVFAGLIRRAGLLGAAALSGLIFALPHLTPTVFIPFTLIGFLFAWSYYKTGSILTTITGHLLFNSLGFAAGLWQAGLVG